MPPLIHSNLPFRSASKSSLAHKGHPETTRIYILVLLLELLSLPGGMIVLFHHAPLLQLVREVGPHGSHLYRRPLFTRFAYRGLSHLPTVGSPKLPIREFKSPSIIFRIRTYMDTLEGTIRFTHYLAQMLRVRAGATNLPIDVLSDLDVDGLGHHHRQVEVVKDVDIRPLL